MARGLSAGVAHDLGQLPVGVGDLCQAPLGVVGKGIQHGAGERAVGLEVAAVGVEAEELYAVAGGDVDICAREGGHGVVDLAHHVAIGADIQVAQVVQRHVHGAEHSGAQRRPPVSELLAAAGHQEHGPPHGYLAHAVGQAVGEQQVAHAVHLHPHGLGDPGLGRRAVVPAVPVGPVAGHRGDRAVDAQPPDAVVLGDVEVALGIQRQPPGGPDGGLGSGPTISAGACHTTSGCTAAAQHRADLAVWGNLAHAMVPGDRNIEVSAAVQGQPRGGGQARAGGRPAVDAHGCFSVPRHGGDDPLGVHHPDPVVARVGDDQVALWIQQRVGRAVEPGQRRFATIAAVPPGCIPDAAGPGQGADDPAGIHHAHTMGKGVHQIELARGVQHHGLRAHQGAQRRTTVPAVAAAARPCHGGDDRLLGLDAAAHAVAHDQRPGGRVVGVVHVQGPASQPLSAGIPGPDGGFLLLPQGQRRWVQDVGHRGPSAATETGWHGVDQLVGSLPV